ncbi:hypothetical protein C8Q76DRAFT_616902 [Earliella scabrosa]|nr:hypothetical protein C8Q76DRAFT_616902 [Earliella scabrosa]
MPQYISPAILRTSPPREPSAQVTPRRRRYPRISSTSPYPSPLPEPSSFQSQSVSALTTFKRRNVQVPSAEAAAHGSPTSTNQWECPHCPYIQHNCRVPDLKRHIATHTRASNEVLWVCCGVPVVEAHTRGIPEEVVREDPAFEFAGRLMVGGCRKTFSRRDALTRHLRREKGRCFGDAFAIYQPGNSLAGGKAS